MTSCWRRYCTEDASSVVWVDGAVGGGEGKARTRRGPTISATHRSGHQRAADTFVFGFPSIDYLDDAGLFSMCIAGCALVSLPDYIPTHVSHCVQHFTRKTGVSSRLDLSPDSQALWFTDLLYSHFSYPPSRHRDIHFIIYAYLLFQKLSSYLWIFGS